jgi:hypothetical protein
MKDKPIREKIKIPVYWLEMYRFLKPESIGKLIDAVCLYSFYGKEICTEEMTESELEAWKRIKRDLDYQFTHRKAYRYPDDEPMRIRNCEEYREWRTAVFERDHYTCQICGKVGGTLNAHHIKRFSEYPELRFDINNGVTLCKECHRLAHRRRAE